MKTKKIKTMIGLSTAAIGLTGAISIVAGGGCASKPEQATPILVPIITTNKLVEGTSGTAVLSVTENNVETWVEPSINLGSSGLRVNPFSGSGLTRTAIIELNKALGGSYQLSIMASGFTSETVNVVVRESSSSIKSISATVYGSLQIGTSNEADISVTGYNGASTIINKIEGSSLDNGILRETHSGNTATISLGEKAIAGDYQLTVHNDQGQTAITSTIVIQSPTPSPEPAPSTINYASWSDVADHFNVDGTTIVGLENDAELNTWMLNKKYNGIDFGNNVHSINSYVFNESITMRSGNVVALKFDSLNFIGNGTFTNCSGLEQIFLGNGQNISIGEKTFENCSNLYLFNVDSTATFDQTNGIGKQAFYSCPRLTSQNLINITNEQLGEIGHWVGTGANAYIENTAGNGCLGCIAFGDINLSGLTSIGDNAFEGCASVKTISEWPKVEDYSWETIGEYAFANCYSLTKILGELPYGFEDIGKFAFYNCTSLTTFPTFDGSMAGLVVIRESTFENCISLNQVSLPDSVESIMDSAFKNCANLKTLTFREGQIYVKLNIGGEAFAGCAAMSYINLEWKHVVGGDGIPETAFSNCAEWGKITVDYSPNDLADAIIKRMPVPENWSYINK